MINNNIAFYATKIILEIGRDLLLFPVWWYTQGLFLVLKELGKFISAKQRSLALLVWIKNIHRPMYGQSDWQGIMISVLVRIVQIIIRSIIMLAWLIFASLLLFVWLLVPFYIIYQIFFQFIPW